MTAPHPVSFDVSIYVASHGKQPRGYGNWGFCTGEEYASENYLDFVLWHTGTFAAAKQRAAAYFRTKLNAETVIVCP